MIKNLSILILGFTIGIFVSPELIPQYPFVDIELINLSEKNIKEIRIINPERKTIYLLENILIGQKSKVDYFPGGETTYELKVTFTDGTILNREPYYVESGYKMTETIYKDKIKTDFNLY